MRKSAAHQRVVLCASIRGAFITRRLFGCRMVPCFTFVFAFSRRSCLLEKKPELASRLLDAARRYHELGRWWCELLLLMPDHLHAIAAFPSEPGMSEVLRNWKRGTARFQHVQWQDGYFDHRLRTEKEARENVGLHPSQSRGEKPMPDRSQLAVVVERHHEQPTTHGKIVRGGAR